jgi:branched-subunit amino acid ABC-type transport system permease component
VPAVTSLLPFLITGIVTGSLYGLAGVGLVLTYRTSGVFNFGHGAIAAGAAYLFFTLHFEHGVSWPLAAVLTVGVFAVVIGWIMERITRRLGDAPEAIVIVTTVGILLGVEGYLFLQFGDVTRSFPDFLPTSGFTLSGVNISWAQTISVIVATTSVIGLYLYLQRSRMGVAMRAVVDDPTLVALSGDNLMRVRRVSWAVGSAFAALSGILLAPTLGLDVNLLTFLVVQAFGAAAIGLFRSLPTTYLGGMAVGLCASLATKFFTRAPFSGVPPAVPFLILLAVLLAVPVSKLPRRPTNLRSLVGNAPAPSRSQAAALAAGGLLLLLVVPAFVGTYLPAWTAGLVYIIVFASLGLLVWTSGQISLCHAAFLAVGATTMAHLTTNHGVPWGVALVLAGLVTMPIGALVAVPAIRLPGLYLALATVGFGILMQDVAYPSGLMFGAELSVSAARPSLGFVDGTSDTTFYYIVLAVSLSCLVAVALIARSRLGRLLRAMAETPTMLATHGLGVNMTRLIVFCVSAFFAGVAGALLVTQFGATSGVAFGPIQSLTYVAVLAICGTRLLRSSILAATFVAVVPAYLTEFGVDRQLLGFGVIAVIAGVVIASRTEMAAAVARRAAASEGRVAGAPPRRPAAARRSRTTGQLNAAADEAGA